MRLGSVAALALSAALAVSMNVLPAVAGTPSATPALPAVAAAGAVRAPAALATALAREHQATIRARRPGTVTGVVRSFTGLPMAGACVSAFGVAGVATARTSGDGRFFLSGLRTGRYALEFRDCARPGRYLPQWSGGGVLRALARQVLVSGGTVTPIAAVTLRPASPATLVARPTAAQLVQAAHLPRAAATAARLGGIAGRLTGPDGHPVRNTCVAIQGSGFTEGVPVSKAGKYSTGRNLPSGHYRVEFAAPECGANPDNWAPQWYKGKSRQSAASIVKIAAGKITRNIDAKLRHGGIISGTVTNQAGAKLTGVCVSLITVGGTFVTQTESEHGGYSIRGLPAGRYRVAFVANCARPTKYLTQWWKNEPSFAKARAITVHLRQAVRGIDARLKIGGTITGTVRSAAGSPLRGICVDATTGNFLTGFDGFTATRQNGRYVIVGLPAGTYSVQFSPGCNNNGNFLSANYPHSIRITGSRTVRGINATLPPGGSLAGTVTNAASQPLQNIAVGASDAKGDGGFACTTVTGAFRMAQLPPGRYTVEFVNGCEPGGNYAPQFFPDQADPDAAIPVKVGLGQQVSHIDAKMQPGATIAGSVTSAAGVPLSKICVTAQPPADAFLTVESGSLVGDPQAETSKTGSYRLLNLAAGRYAVEFTECGAPKWANRWFGGRPGSTVGDIVDVGAGATVDGISTALSAGGAITGTARSAAGKPVTTSCEVITNLRTGSVTAAGLTNSSADNYGAAGLSPGRYTVEFYTCILGANYAIQWFNRKPGPQTATTVRVTAGHITGAVDAALPKGGRISGRLTDRATGKPLRDFCVEATSGDFFGFGFTRRNGDYVVHGLNSRTYHLAFTNCNETSTTAANVRRTATVHVTAPRTTAGINAALPVGGSISGNVRAGSPAAGQDNVCVDADPVSAGGLENFTATSQDGHYALTNLRPGKYRVFFDTRTDCDNSPNGLVPQWYRAARSRATGTTVTVAGGQDTAGIDATLAADGGISGTVTAAATAAPLTGVCVRAVPQAAGLSASFTASADGSYSFAGLIPGQYTVQFSSGCGAAGYPKRWWDDAVTAATATVLNVRANTVSTGIDAALSK